MLIPETKFALTVMNIIFVKIFLFLLQVHYMYIPLIYFISFKFIQHNHYMLQKNV